MQEIVIKQVAVTPRCYGPIEYELTWECQRCGKCQLLGIRGTLLLEGMVACRHCGESFHYLPVTMDLDPAMLQRIDRIERRVLALLDQDEDMALLGSNATFAIAACLSNELRESQ